MKKLADAQLLPGMLGEWPEKYTNIKPPCGISAKEWYDLFFCL